MYYGKHLTVINLGKEPVSNLSIRDDCHKHKAYPHDKKRLKKTKQHSTQSVYAANYRNTHSYC